jgi:WD40 repeat protein
VLAELRYGVEVADVVWAPAGDALAISGSGGGVYVWSQAGITKAFSSPMYTRLAWSPDGAWIGIPEAALWALPASGPPVRFSCEPQPGQPTAGSGYEPMCPFFPHMVWSLDSKEVAVGGGDRAGMLGTASLADPTFRHFGIPGIVEGDTVPVEWLDAQELLAFDQNDQLILIPLNDPWSYRVLTRIPSGGLQPGLHYDESVSADGSMLKVTELASGRETTLFTAPPGSGDGIGNVTWSPDGWRLAFTIPDSAGRPTLKVINVDESGLKELLVGQFNLAGGGSLTTDTPWQSIWP